MKKLIVILAAFAALMSGQAWGAAAGSWTAPALSVLPGANLAVIETTGTASADDASFPDLTLSITNLMGWSVQMVTTDPGATAPTDNYDFELLDGDGVDVMGGELYNRDTAVSEQVTPMIGSSPGYRPVDGDLVLHYVAASNAVNSATVTFKIWFRK